MKTRTFSRLFAAVVLTVASLLTINAPSAYAATNTWTGAANDGQWDTAGNWTGGVPNDGDDLVFNNSSYGAGGVNANIPNFVANSITFINDGSTPINIQLSANITVTEGIAQAASVTSSVNTIASSSGSHTLTLGDAATVTATAGLSLGSSSDTINLNGKSLTFVTDSGYSGNNTVTVRAVITGSGTVTYNSSKTNYVIYGANTYSGTTNVTSSRLPVGPVNNNNAFGSSTINVSNGAGIIFRYSSNKTISNTINVAGGSNLSTSLTFTNTGSTARTFTIPHVLLNGNTRFQNTASPVSLLTIDLSGIAVRGHCVEYVSNTTSGLHSGKAAGFVNAPTSCTADTNVNAPDTGLASTTSHALPVLIVSSIAAIVLLVLARRIKLTANK